MISRFRTELGALFTRHLRAALAKTWLGPLVAPRRRRLLIVEDDPSVSYVLETLLGYEGYNVTTAADVRSAIDALKRRSVDGVVLDLNLPDGNGLEVLRHLRELSGTTPVVVLSGLKQEDAVVEALDLGANDYVTKPFGIRELAARVRTRIGA